MAKYIKTEEGYKAMEQLDFATKLEVEEYAQPKGDYLTAIPDGYAKTEDIPTKPEDIGALPNTYTPPNQTAEQVGADPKGTAQIAVGKHNVDTDSHNDIRLELKELSDRLTAFFDSDDTTLDELSEIVAYITSNKALIDSITTSKVNVADIINNLTTNVANKPLSAAQGVALKGLIDAVGNSLSNYQPKGDYALASAIPTKVSQLQNDKGYLTEHQDISGKLDADKLPEAVNNALAQAKESGEFDGADGYTPVRGVDYYTEADKAEFSEYIASELAKRGQLKPEFANSIEECTDTTKLYVLPDGYIYAYMLTETEGSVEPNFTNLMDADGAYVKDGYRYSHSSAAFKEYTSGTSIVFPYKAKTGTHTFRIRGGSISNYSTTSIYMGSDNQTFGSVMSVTSTTDSNGDIVYTSVIGGDIDGYVTIVLEGVADVNSIIVTMDEEITYTTTEGGIAHIWSNTGHAFVPADYENRIVELENHVDDVESKLDFNGNVLFGKKWVACGDSYTAGGYTSTDGFAESVYKYQNGRFAGKNIVYPHIIGLRNNMNIVNLATGGQTMANSANSFMTRYSTIDADADYITIMLGINDKGQGISVGTLEDSTNTTFCGAFNIAMEHILANHPLAHVGIIVSNDTSADFMEATRGIAERWGVPYLDFGSSQVPLMNGHTGRNVCSKAEEIRWQNFCVSPTSNGHPNTAAHEYESTFIEAWLRTL